MNYFKTVFFTLVRKFPKLLQVMSLAVCGLLLALCIPAISVDNPTEAPQLAQQGRVFYETGQLHVVLNFIKPGPDECPGIWKLGFRPILQTVQHGDNCQDAFALISKMGH